jgi:hypothetical protein
MLKVIVLLFAAYVAQISAQSRPYTSLGWSSCSTAAQTPAIKIDRLSILPMVAFDNKVIYYYSLKFYLFNSLLDIQEAKLLMLKHQASE